MHRLARILFAAAIGLLVLLTGGTPAAAHGAPSNPLSRSMACGASGPDAAGPACVAAREASPQLIGQWDNIRVAGVNGRDREMIPDGALCSAGIPTFRGLDLPRTDWPVTALVPGATQWFDYAGTIPHQGTFRLFVTRPGYTPDRPLSWSDIEPEPFLTVTDPPLRFGAYRFEGALPAGRTGRALIYTVWQNSSTPDTYYSCSDVDFGGAPAPLPAAAAPAAEPSLLPPIADVRPLALAAGGVLLTGLIAAWVLRGRRG